ncbi:NAD(P)H-binding protein [Nocardioides sp. C4-1]|uniref:NmrA family NAD(P)-binding protein n=1 Tax=Nocardioides sp. C4-1 TaxID=3151851 RepID=UPI00326759F3
MTTRVLVTGIRGKTGVPLAALLAERDVEVLGGSSDPSSVRLEGVVPTAFSWDDAPGWPAALDGVDAVFVVRPDRSDAPGLVADLVAATAPGTRVVLLSERAADYPQLDHWALRVEDAVREGGRPWTILRPSWFMDVFTDPRFYRDEIAAGTLTFPGAEARVAWVDARDIAAVAAVSLLDEGHTGQVYEITGPESLTPAETAAALGVEPTEASVEEAIDGMTGFDRDLSLVTFDRVRDGAFAEVTGDVERATGRPARPLAAFVVDHASAWR